MITVIIFIFLSFKVISYAYFHYLPFFYLNYLFIKFFNILNFSFSLLLVDDLMFIYLFIELKLFFLYEVTFQMYSLFTGVQDDLIFLSVSFRIIDYLCFIGVYHFGVCVMLLRFRFIDHGNLQLISVF